MTNSFRTILLFIVLFLVSDICFSQSSGKLVWFDEFNGTGIPDQSKWERMEYNRRQNSNGPDGWWEKDDAYLDGNGNMVIRVRKVENRNNDSDTHDYSCGAVRTKNKFEQLHGIFQIRCKLPTQQGWWVAFWMMQGNVGSTANGGVDGSEVDIMEGFGWTDKVNQAIHWDGYGDAHKSTGKKVEIDGLRNGFHTYTLEWHPDEYIFYIDGEETWRTTGGGVCNQPGYLKVTGEISTLNNLTGDWWAKNPEQAQYPDSFLVDYVRVYEFSEVDGNLPIRDLVETCYPEGNLAVGSACHEFYLGTPTEEILDREFSYVTPANDFKQGYIHPEPGVWNWEKSDKWINHCRENKQVMRLHAPISPQVSKWAKTDTRTAAELEQNLIEYVTALCQRYNDSSQVKWLDVVNETVDHSNGDWFGPKEGNEKWENPWPKMGYDESHELRPPIYIKKAFEVAQQYGTNFKFIINQHGGMDDFIWNKIKKTVAYLRENNLRVDGIGWQAHLWTGWEKTPGNLEKLGELIDWCHANNLEFHITEFNSWLKPEDADKLAEQANTFYAVTKVAAQKQKSGFVGINLWHIRGVETANKDRDGCPWAENYEPKEAYFRIKDALCEASEYCLGECGGKILINDVDTFKTGGNINFLGGEWLAVSDANSTQNLDLKSPDGENGSTCAKLNWELKKGASNFPYAVFQTYLNAEKNGTDLDNYFALKFQARGNGVINIGLITQQSSVQGNHFFKEIVLTEDWKNYEIPFSAFSQNWGTISELDTDSVIAIIFSAATEFNEPGTMWLDNLQLINEMALSPVEPEKPIQPKVSFRPKVNQTGYLPNAYKEFSIVSDSVLSNQEFVILNKENTVVYSGNVGGKVVNDSEISGESVYRVNFSDFKIPGTYRIKVKNFESYPFDINEEVYDSLLNNVLRFFYLVRANFAMNDPVSGLSHPGGHLSDGTLDDGSGNTIDLKGGWYNAGDYGKWAHTTAFTCSHLLNLYELNPNYFKLQNLSIPESENEMPDLLDQVKVGLAWLLKLQNENGSVFHKVDSEPNFAYGYGPDEDPHTRKIGYTDKFSTIDAADFTAVMAHAAQVFERYDTTFANSCKNAAIKSWQWVQSNTGIGQDDIYYTDPQSWQEELWAKIEVFLLTEDESMLSSIYFDIRSKEMTKPSWTAPQSMAYFRLYEHENVPSTVKIWILSKLEGYGNSLKTIVDNSGYGTAIKNTAWGWGTNTDMSNFGATFTYLHRITGDDDWLKYASLQLDYLLGRNSLDYSFVTGFGTNFCEQPFHWIPKTYKITPKGFIGQGAASSSLMHATNVDRYIKELMEAGFPPAKTYVDTLNSWNSNEVGIYTMSSLAFLTGYLALHDREVVISDVPEIQPAKRNLTVIDAKNKLYCMNCEGTTQVNIYSLNGQCIYSNEINAPFSNEVLVNYESYVQKYPFLLYEIIDEKGQIKTGKLVNKTSGF